MFIEETVPNRQMTKVYRDTLHTACFVLFCSRKGMQKEEI